VKRSLQLKRTSSVESADAPFSSATLTEARALIEALDAALDGWGRVWRVPELRRMVRYEFSGRLRGSLGRCHQGTGRVRLNEALLAPDNRNLLFETLCHEAAHVAVWRLYGPRTKPHGPEWRRLVALAGYTSRATIPAGEVNGLKPSSRRVRQLYEYRCPVCEMVHMARRKNSRWRCRVCLNAGRSGHLTIKRIGDDAREGGR
jgi:predicted SprT family Zn-dependent metalloprotease